MLPIVAKVTTRSIAILIDTFELTSLKLMVKCFHQLIEHTDKMTIDQFLSDRVISKPYLAELPIVTFAKMSATIKEKKKNISVSKKINKKQPEVDLKKSRSVMLLFNLFSLWRYHSWPLAKKAFKNLHQNGTLWIMLCYYIAIIELRLNNFPLCSFDAVFLCLLLDK